MSKNLHTRFERRTMASVGRYPTPHLRPDPVRAEVTKHVRPEDAGLLQHTACLPITSELYRNVESLDECLDPCDEPQSNWNLPRNEKLTSSNQWSVLSRAAGVRMDTRPSPRHP